MGLSGRDTSHIFEPLRSGSCPNGASAPSPWASSGSAASSPGCWTWLPRVRGWSSSCAAATAAARPSTYMASLTGMSCSLLDLDRRDLRPPRLRPRLMETTYRWMRTAAPFPT